MALDTFLIDTNVISNSSKRDPHPAISDWLSAQVNIAIPFPVFLEIQAGIAERRRINSESADSLERWFDRLQSAIFMYPEVTPTVARLLGEMMCCRPLTNLWSAAAPARCRKPGQDLFIAAIAIVHRLPIATLNARDFETIHRYFPLPGVFHPAFGIWLISPDSECEEQADNEIA